METKSELSLANMLVIVAMVLGGIASWYSVKGTAEAAAQLAHDNRAYIIELKKDIVDRLDRIENKLDKRK